MKPWVMLNAIWALFADYRRIPLPPRRNRSKARHGPQTAP
jgi:hypothetical protein